MGKHSLVGGCSIYSGFDGSVGTVSSVGSLYSQVVLLFTIGANIVLDHARFPCEGRRTGH